MGSVAAHTSHIRLLSYCVRGRAVPSSRAAAGRLATGGFRSPGRRSPRLPRARRRPGGEQVERAGTTQSTQEAGQVVIVILFVIVIGAGRPTDPEQDHDHVFLPIRLRRLAPPFPPQVFQDGVHFVLVQGAVVEEHFGQGLGVGISHLAEHKTASSSSTVRRWPAIGPEPRPGNTARRAHSQVVSPPATPSWASSICSPETFVLLRADLRVPSWMRPPAGQSAIRNR